LQADSRWFSPQRVADAQWRVMATGDWNADGHPDLVWQHRGTGELAIWYLQGAVLLDSLYLQPMSVTDLTWRIVGSG